MKLIILKITLFTTLLIGGHSVTFAQAPQQPPPAIIPEAFRAQEPATPAQEMRNLVRDISKYARKFSLNFSIITSGGLEILEKEDAVDTTKTSPATTYMRSIDGINIQGLNFHPPLAGKGSNSINTDKKTQANMIRLANIAKQRGLKVFVTDFGDNIKTIQESYNLNLPKGFVNFTAKNSGTEYIFNNIPTTPFRPVNENSKNIVGLKSIQNYLYLIDSSKFDRQQDFVIALGNTNFDAVVVDVFHNGRKPFTKAAIQGMKFKKLGARRLVFAYMNIGVADNYRYYWKNNWVEGEPPFISGPSPGNPDKFYVEYWRSGWRNIITGNTKSYIYGIVKQGFDGVIIDGLDSFKFFESGGN
jgi:cysteinyl-tRNA synthetase